VVRDEEIETAEPIDHPADERPGGAALAPALGLLGELHRLRTQASVPAVLERLYDRTRILAALTGTAEVSLMLMAPGLRVIHVTTHMGLLEAIERIDAGLVERTIARGRELIVRAGVADPRVAVCGINPHAGEAGLFGRGEEAAKIEPAQLNIELTESVLIEKLAVALPHLDSLRDHPRFQGLLAQL